MSEVWKDIDDYEGLYQVSNMGRVRSLDRIVKNHYSFKQVKGRILKQTSTKLNYKRVTFSINQKQKSFLVHRLIAKAFIPNPHNCPIINHKDENPANNNISNLEWCTHTYNMNYGTAISRKTKKLLNKQGAKKVYQYLKGELIKVWPSASECRRSGFSQGHVSSCCRGVRKQHKGFTWSYEKM